MEKTETKLQDIIKYHINSSDNEVRLSHNTNILLEYGLDSIQIVNIIADIEMAFNIHLSMDGQTMDAIQKYGTLKELVYNKAGAGEMQNV